MTSANGCSRPLGADAVRAEAHLHVADHLALGERQVGHAQDHDDRDGQDLPDRDQRGLQPRRQRGPGCRRRSRSCRTAQRLPPALRRVCCSGPERRTTASTAYMPTSRVASSAASRPVGERARRMPGLVLAELARAARRAPPRSSGTRSPRSPSRLPSTRSTFHAGRASPGGRAAPGTLCQRPSRLTQVPDVSAKAADRQDHRGAAPLLFASRTAVRATTHSAPCRAAASAPEANQVRGLDAADQQVAAQARVEHLRSREAGLHHRTSADAAMRRGARQRWRRRRSRLPAGSRGARRSRPPARPPARAARRTPHGAPRARPAGSGAARPGQASPRSRSCSASGATPSSAARPRSPGRRGPRHAAQPTSTAATCCAMP